MTAIIALLTINTFINIVYVYLLYHICENVFDLHFDVRYLKNEKIIEKYHKTREHNIW